LPPVYTGKGSVCFDVAKHAVITLELLDRLRFAFADELVGTLNQREPAETIQ